MATATRNNNSPAATLLPANGGNPAPRPAPFTGKYGPAIAKLGGNPLTIPAFAAIAAHLYVNPAANTAPKAKASGTPNAMLTVYGMVQANPGLTGKALVQAMLAHNWAGHPSQYCANGSVCAHWCVGYVNGLLSGKHAVTGPAPQGNA